MVTNETTPAEMEEIYARLLLNFPRQAAELDDDYLIRARTAGHITEKESFVLSFWCIRRPETAEQKFHRQMNEELAESDSWPWLNKQAPHNNGDYLREMFRGYQPDDRLASTGILFE